MSEAIRVAVVGATNLVGQSVLELLAERELPIERVYALDVAEKEGESAYYGNLELDVLAVEEFDFANAALAVFVSGSDMSRQYVQAARAAGCAVIDFSGAYRQADDVPLYAPLINDKLLDDLGEAPLVSIPNCTATPLAQALAAIKAAGLQRVTVTTFQSVSGSGQAALEELASQTTALFSQRDAEVEVFPKRIAFNVLPLIGAVDELGVSEEEQSVAQEVRKLLALPELVIEASCVRVPVFFGHGWAVSVESDDALTADKARELFKVAGLQVVDDPAGDMPYVTPLEASGNEAVWVSRVRRQGKSLQFWLAADNIRAAIAHSCVTTAAALMKRGYFA